MSLEAGISLKYMEAHFVAQDLEMRSRLLWRSQTRQVKKKLNETQFV